MCFGPILGTLSEIRELFWIVDCQIIPLELTRVVFDYRRLLLFRVMSLLSMRPILSCICRI